MIYLSSNIHLHIDALILSLLQGSFAKETYILKEVVLMICQSSYIHWHILHFIVLCVIHTNTQNEREMSELDQNMRVVCGTYNHHHISVRLYIRTYNHLSVRLYIRTYDHLSVRSNATSNTWPHYGVATVSRLLKMIGLFCRISSLLQGSFAKETYHFKEPIYRSHPIWPPIGAIKHNIQHLTALWGSYG